MIENGKNEVLLHRCSSVRTWSFAGGGVEIGDSFTSAAITEMREETGFLANKEDLIPIATYSKPDFHITHYPNGDVTHYFSMVYLVKEYTGTLKMSPDESLEIGFYHPDRLPDDAGESVIRLFGFLKEFKEIGKFTNC